MEYGSDIALINNYSDIALDGTIVKDVDNLIQSVVTAVKAVKNSNDLHKFLGTDYYSFMGLADIDLATNIAKNEVLEALSYNPRVTDVNFVEIIKSTKGDIQIKLSVWSEGLLIETII